MKAEDLKTKTQDELTKLLLDTRKNQFNLRFQRSGGALDNTSEIRKTRRNIARIKTFLSLKQSDVSAGGAKEKPVAKKPAAKKTTKSKTKAA